MAIPPIPEEDFESLVDDAIDALPEEILAMLDNVAIRVEDDHPEGLLGLYEGTPLTEREAYGYGMELPDVVTLYRLALCEYVESPAELVEEVRVTLVHELAHHLGIDDARLHELGWA